MSHLTELPKGWIETTLGDSVVIEMGQSPDGSATNTVGHGLPLIGGASDLGANLPHPTRYTSTPTKVSEIGDLILCVRATIGKLNYADDHYCLGRGVAGLRPISFERDWLRYYLDYSAEDLDQAGTGSTFRQIDKATLQNWSISLPPLNEQRRIVAKIEALKARSQQVKEALEAIPPLLDQFRQSVLAAAFRGDLTADWRSQNPDVEPASVLLEYIRAERRRRWEEVELEKMKAQGKTPKDDKWKEKYKEFSPIDNLSVFEKSVIPTQWSWVTIGDVAECLDKMRVPINKDKRAKRIGDIPYYGANSQVGWIDNYIFDEPLVIVVEDETFIGRTKPFCYKISGKSWVNNHAHVLRATDVVEIDYLNYSLMFYPFIPLTSGSTGRRKLTQAALMSAPYPVAPLAEQQEIVRRVELFFKSAEQIEQQYQSAKAYLDQLDQSILAKAFRGELVSQDPSDEPASILLERIQAEREKREAEAKVAKKSMGKTTGQRSRKAKQQDLESIQLGLPGLE